ITLNFPDVQSRKASVVDNLYKGVQTLMKKGKIDVIEGFGRILGPSIFSPVPGTISVEHTDGRENTLIAPENVLIATGSTPKTLPGLEVDGTFVITKVPSTSKPGSVFGVDPVAIRTFSGAIKVFSRPSVCSTDIVPGTGEKILGPNIRPNPSITSIFPFFINVWTPLYKLSTTLAFLDCTSGKFKVISFASIPKSELAFVWRYTSALRNKALEGIHPLCKQVPPSFSASTMATCLPSCAALIAATYPPVPPPSTTKSYVFAIVFAPL